MQGGSINIVVETGVALQKRTPSEVREILHSGQTDAMSAKGKTMISGPKSQRGLRSHS